jgi:DNA topoisomerase-3
MEIEAGEHSAKRFIYDMKRMVYDLVVEVFKEKKTFKLAAPQATESSKTKKKTKSKPVKAGDALTQCPKCSNGNIVKGKNAYGCSGWKSGCDFRLPFVFMDKKLTDNQVKRLIDKKSTTKLKGFKQGDSKLEGVLKLTNDFNVEFEAKSSPKASATSDKPLCPKCGKGELIKGKPAYGCSNWKQGCKFTFSFESIREKAQGQKLSKELVMSIIAGK